MQIDGKEAGASRTQPRVTSKDAEWIHGIMQSLGILRG
jgi:hypothetical protein